MGLQRYAFQLFRKGTRTSLIGFHDKRDGWEGGMEGGRIKHLSVRRGLLSGCYVIVIWSMIPFVSMMLVVKIVDLSVFSKSIYLCRLGNDVQVL